MKSLIHSKGQIDVVLSVKNKEFNQNQLVIQGWSLAMKEPSIDSALVRIGNVDIGIEQLRLHLESEDVAEVFGDPSAKHCRFEIETGLLPDDKSPDKDLVFVQLMGDSVLAAPLLYIPKSSIPEISDTEAIPVGGGSEATSSEFLCHFIHLCDLKPSGRVLDIGCGMGRIGRAIAFYLNDEGLYRGLDIVESWIQRAGEIVTSRRPNFVFEHLDIRNHMYNPDGKVKAAEVVLPYEDDFFDLVNLSSVFTHMGSDEVERYIAEISRVLKKGGRVLATSFLLTDEAKDCIDRGVSDWNIKHPRDASCFVHNPAKPDVAVGFVPENYRSWYDKNGLEKEYHFEGSWCGRKNYFSYQDLSVYRKR